MNTGGLMKALFVLGLVVLVLGVLSFFVPLPHRERHGIAIGDASIGVTTSHKETVSPIVSGVLVLAGAGMLIAGRGKGG
jgi:hypothetical protein